MKKIIFLSLLLAACGTSPAQREVDAYGIYLRSEVNEGRIGRTQAEWMYQAKINEVNSRAQANAANNAAMGMMGLSLMNAGVPRPVGGTATCRRVPLGNGTEQISCF